MDHYSTAARIAVAQIDGGTSLPFAETVRLSSEHATQGQSGDEDELLQCTLGFVLPPPYSTLRLTI